MNDEEFLKLDLAGRIAPTQVRWPESGSSVYWAKLHRAADTTRAAVEAAWAAQNRIEKDPDLTLPAKRRIRAQIAEKAIADLAEDKHIVGAKRTAEEALERWRAKAKAVIKKPDDACEVALHQEIRQHVSGLKDTERLSFIARTGDAAVLSALLLAPPFLSGLTKNEIAIVQAKAKTLTESSLDPEIRKAKAATEGALADLNRGHRVAMKLIAERGGLVQDATGSWVVPAVA
jgi:hypothetical protein